MYEYDSTNIDVLFQKYGYYVPILLIGYENHIFYREDIDESLVLKEVR